MNAKPNNDARLVVYVPAEVARKIRAEALRVGDDSVSQWLRRLVCLVAQDIKMEEET